MGRNASSAHASLHCVPCTCFSASVFSVLQYRNYFQYCFPNDDFISSALTYVLLMRLASCSYLRQEKLKQKNHRQQNPVSLELGIALFQRSGLLWMGSWLFPNLLLIAHVRTKQFQSPVLLSVDGEPVGMWPWLTLLDLVT